MLTQKNSVKNFLSKKRKFFTLTIAALLVFLPTALFAHQSPNSLIFLDVSPKSVAMEIQLPLPELELAFGNAISQNPETLVEKFGPQLKEYLLAHIHAYSTKNNPWQVEIESLIMDKGKYIETGIPYWELIAKVNLKPQLSESTRKFTLDYDVILHQVINHVALVSIRNDWETGKIEAATPEATVISWNTKDNVIYPLKINLDKGSWWIGFKSMIKLGMEHIKEGTDHLLFLLVLLLPATLMLNEKKWGKFRGLKSSVFGLLKIVTAFTIGHSITLIISAFGWIYLPAQLVEILIAISILISAIHAIYPLFPNKEIYIAAGFGLVHGLAFATVLSDLNLDGTTLVLSVLGFNIGIEIMQLFVITLVIPWVVILSQTDYYKYFRIISALIAILLSLSWVFQQISGHPNKITTSVENGRDNVIYGLVVFAIFAVSLFYIHRIKGKNQNAINNLIK